ncbi:MAG TPA: hypothetical protein VG099_24705, partial [Gemmataceae bacterium]|nr:hypothetical protein [Gemmataceae bacterium]
SDLREAINLWAKLPSLESEARFERCRTLSLLAGLGGDAKSGVTAAEAATFADQAVTALADAINAGWGNTKELKESDFDPLRNRADFRKLLAELETHKKPVPK